ncbi:MAG: NAD(P)/FAD-dependent oxidoreductase [Burkholderiaceae bacterium]
MSDRYDVAVIGAGAAGMMCAAVAGQRGRSVVLLDHAARLAEKIRISGGGRCNFTNRDVGPANFISQNPRFARSALERYTPQDFIDLVMRYRIGFHEKHRGQLFCDESSEQIIAMLVAECDAGGVDWRRPVRIVDLTADAVDGYRIDTDGGALFAKRVVIASGGLSIPKIGATDFAYRTAKRFGLRIVEPRPALVPLTFDAASWAPFAALSGLALEVDIGCEQRSGEPVRFREDLLFTHRGLSGPAVLQISSYWKPGGALDIDLVPAVDLCRELLEKKDTSKQNLSQVLAAWLPKRLAAEWQARSDVPDRRLAEVPNGILKTFAAGLEQWRLTPDGTEGFRKAEVTAGGIDTAGLSQRTLESRHAPGLHFIGEAVDVTGWLGGYNFQWAWSSGFAAGQAV